MNPPKLGIPWLVLIGAFAIFVFTDSLSLAAPPGAESAVLRINTADYSARRDGTRVQGDRATGNVVLTNADTGSNLVSVTPDTRGK